MHLHHCLLVSLSLAAPPATSAQTPQGLLTPDSAIFRLPLVARTTADRTEVAPPDVATRWWLLTWDEPARGWISPAFGGYGLGVSLPDSLAAGRPLTTRIRQARVAAYEEAGAGSMPGLAERQEPAAQLQVEGDTLVLLLGRSPTLVHLWEVHPASMRFFTRSPWGVLVNATWVHTRYAR
jgi:hypothetical protein